MRSRIRATISKGFRLVTDHLPDAAAVNLIYFRHLGRLPRLARPVTFNEKVTWRKLYQKDCRFPLFTDKIAVKEEIARLLGSQYVVPTLWVGDDPAAIPFDALEPPYVLKVSHSSGGNIFVRRRKDADRDSIVAS